MHELNGFEKDKRWCLGREKLTPQHQGCRMKSAEPSCARTMPTMFPFWMLLLLLCKRQHEFWLWGSVFLRFLQEQSLLWTFFLIRVMMFDDHGILEPEENHLLQLSSTDVHRAACVLTSFFLKSTISSLVLLMLSYRLFSENLSMWTLTVIL